MSAVPFLRWTVRLAGLLSLLLGLGLWNGRGSNVHQGLGFLMTGALVGLAVVTLRRASSPAGLALLWSVVLVAAATMQQRLFPNGPQWAAGVLHLLLGLGAIVLAELIGSRMREPSAKARKLKQLT